MNAPRTLMLLAVLPLVGAIPERCESGTEPTGAAFPVALAWGADGRLRVALRDARSLTVVDPTDWAVKSRQDLPFQPSTLTRSEDGRGWFVGGTQGEVAFVPERGEPAMIRQATGRGPTRALPLGADRLAVASRWDDQLRILDLSSRRERRAIPLGFPPGSMVREPGGGLIVADAFGPRVARVDHELGTLQVVTIDGVNLRGLTIASEGRELLLVHASQYQALPVTSANLDWGLILSSGLTSLRLSEFQEGEAAPKPPRLRLTLDGSKHGAADPSALALSRDGSQVFVAVAGAHQVLRTRRAFSGPATLGENQELDVRQVGQMPVDLAIDPSDRFLVTADALSDTLTVLRVDDLSPVAVVPLTPRDAVRTAVQRGEGIFHDARRSLDRWTSCASCHPEGHTNGLNFDTLGDGSYGAAKNTPSLLGVGQSPPYGWVGNFAT
ncbi:MAG: cytochrome C peroxidase, partial [Isosphaeraceae bacterium]